MKFTKIDGVRICTLEKGVFYNSSKTMATDKHITERIKQANDSTERLYSAFIKPNKHFRYNKKRKDDEKSQFYCWLNGNLKPPFKNVVGIDDAYKLYLNTKKNFVEEFENIKEIREIIENEIKKVSKSRENRTESIIKSFENQRVPIVFSGEAFEPSFANQELNEIFTALVGDYDKEKNKMIDSLGGFFDSLEMDLYKDAERDITKPTKNGAYKSEYVYDKATTINNLKKIARVHNAKDNLIVSKAVEFIISDFQKGNYIDKERYAVDRIKKRVLGSLITYFAGKCIQRGKYMHYHDLAENSETEWTSFHLEMIEAVEELRRKFAVAFSFAYFNLGRALEVSFDKDYLSKNIAYSLSREKDKKIKLFFGGETFFNKNYSFINSNDFTQFVNLLRKQLSWVRNKTIHYEYRAEKTDNLDDSVIIECIRKEFELRETYLREKYKSNMVGGFYRKEFTEKLIKNSAKRLPSTKPYFPGFSRLKDYLLAHFPIDNKKHEQAWLFLMKEIYYNEFLCDVDKYDYNAIKEIIAKYAPTQQGEEHISENEAYVKLTKGLSLKDCAEKIHIEFMLANAGRRKQDKLKNDNLNIIFRKIVAELFIIYAKNKYPFLFECEGAADDLQGSGINADCYTNEASKGLYVLAKLTTPTALSELVHALMKFEQFSNDIIKRHSIVYDEKTQSFKEFSKKILPPFLQGDDANQAIKNTITLLRVCQQSVGWVSPPEKTVDRNGKTYYWQEFFADEGQYNDFMKKFVDDTILEDEIYKNLSIPVIRRQIVQSFMYGTSDIISAVYGENKVTEADISEYNGYKQKEDSNYQSKKLIDISNADELKSEIEKRKNQIRYIQNVHKAELYPVQRLHSLFTQLYSNLIVWIHIWERDLQFFLLGIGVDKATVKGIFEYDGKSMTSKFKEFLEEKPNYKPIIDELFLRISRKEADRLHFRNKIAHFNFAACREYSLFELYNLMRGQMSYSRKHQNAVMTKLRNTAERFDVDISKAIVDTKEGLRFDKDKACVLIRKIPCNKKALKDIGKEKEELGIDKGGNYTYRYITEQMKTSAVDLITKKLSD